MRFELREHGAVLLVCLVFLLVISALVFSGTGRVALDIRLNAALEQERLLLRTGQQALADVAVQLAEMEQFAQPCQTEAEQTICLSDRAPGTAVEFDPSWVFRLPQRVSGYTVHGYLSAIAGDVRDDARAYQLDIQLVGKGNPVIDPHCRNGRYCLREVVMQHGVGEQP